ncbi:MAG TPA: hypothetical protein VEA38_25490 [Terriglobales bacterium]|nr:hypothetical protein [Terriglobales bacterium]
MEKARALACVTCGRNYAMHVMAAGAQRSARAQKRYHAWAPSPDAIAAALAAEREMAAVFMCGACRRGHERHVSADGAQLVHHLNDGMQARGEPYRVVACGASAYLRLRAAGPPPPAAGGARATEA